MRVSKEPSISVKICARNNGQPTTRTFEVYDFKENDHIIIQNIAAKLSKSEFNPLLKPYGVQIIALDTKETVYTTCSLDRFIELLKTEITKETN